jgi:hypothetical protein
MKRKQKIEWENENKHLLDPNLSLLSEAKNYYRVVCTS